MNDSQGKILGCFAIDGDRMPLTNVCSCNKEKRKGSLSGSIGVLLPIYRCKQALVKESNYVGSRYP